MGGTIRRVRRVRHGPRVTETWDRELVGMLPKWRQGVEYRSGLAAVSYPLDARADVTTPATCESFRVVEVQGEDVTVKAWRQWTDSQAPAFASILAGAYPQGSVAEVNS